jgi:hypothetical protein
MVPECNNKTLTFAGENATGQDQVASSSSSPSASVAAHPSSGFVVQSEASYAGLSPERAATWDEACVLLKGGVWPITDGYKPGVSFFF